jgi:hypothetical protein
MTVSAVSAAAFYRDVAKSRTVWAIRDAGGFPAPKTLSGERAMPFWSSSSRVQKIIANVPAYAGFEPVEISWDEFCDKWLPGLAEDGLLVGVNWSGKKAKGYDLQPHEVRANIEAVISLQQNPVGQPALANPEGRKKKPA